MDLVSLPLDGFHKEEDRWRANVLKFDETLEGYR